MTALPSVAGLGWTSPTGADSCARASPPSAPSASRRGGAPRLAERYRARERSRTELAPAAGRAAKRTQYARDKGEGKLKPRLR